MGDLPEHIDGLPNLCGREDLVAEAVARGRERPATRERLPLDGVDSGYAIALHMHQPLIPAGGDDLHTAALISNLQWMLAHPDVEDNHNAQVFAWCYQRMGEFVPALLAEGYAPRVMLDYSGTLLHGLRAMGLHDVIDALSPLARGEGAGAAVEWLGSAWGHPVAPSTPVQDFALHVRAWQHHFAATFGLEALEHVRGFSPAEMALPNDPDVAHAFVATLRDCGYDWVLVQEHTVEHLDGLGVADPHVPHRLACTSSAGEIAEITAVIKTQGSDTKLVGQMQPYYQAQSEGPREIAGVRVPPLVTQIADGENGGVMMNEFPGKYHEVVRESSHSRTPGLNVTEWLEQLHAAGLDRSDLPTLQPVGQHRIWDRLEPGQGPDRLAAVVDELAREDDRFHVEGGSWTGDVSWVRGYEDVLSPMLRASAMFQQQALAPGVPTGDARYRDALFHLLSAETSCYRYWGAGRWTDYGAEIARRAIDVLTHDL